MAYQFRITKIQIFNLLLSLVLVLPASAQNLSRRPLPKEPLEKFEDAPMLLWRTGLSPGMVSQQGPYTSYQVNVNASGQNITGDAANEPSICVDPTNPNRMSIGWRQFNSVASNFRQAGWGYTSNGGITWIFPGTLENNVFRSDPVLNSDSTGKFFYLSLLQSFFDDMWTSVNGGATFARLASARGGDKQWFTIDNTDSTGHGFHYQSWSTDGNNYQGRQFTRSTDGGLTWLNPVNIPNSPTWGTLDVDTDGNLFISGVNQITGQVWCLRSSNAKNAAVTPSFDQSTPVNLGGSITINASINPVGLVGQVNMAVDRSGTSTNNNVCFVASVQPTGFTTGSEVMFVRSSNSGQSFSSPRRINDDPVNHSKWHWFGTLAVAPNGRIDVTWLDTRNAANNTDSQLFYSYSTDGGDTWSPNVAVSTPFNPFLGYPNQSKMGDYMTIVSDNAGGNVAYCATFNGEQDIYYVRVFPATPTVQSAVSRKTHGPAGDFDIVLPLSGTPGIECRIGGATNDHKLIITFTGAVTVTGTPQAQITAGAGEIGSGGVGNGGMVTIDGNSVTVPLTNVNNTQTISVTLFGVNGSANVVIPMSVLAGDVNANGVANAGDIALAKSQLGQPVSATNFRADVNANGATNSTDLGLIKSASGTGLP